MSDSETEKPTLSPDQIKQIGVMRQTMLSRLGEIVLLFAGVNRYGHQPLSEIHRLCIAPMMRDRIAIAKSGSPDGDKTGETASLLGLALWANVSKEIDAKITEQVREGVFPVKMASADWNSGDIIWLLDVVAPSREISKRVLGNFRSVLKAQNIDLPDGQIKIHPVIKRTIGEEALTAMGAVSMKDMEQQKSKAPLN